MRPLSSAAPHPGLSAFLAAGVHATVAEGGSAALSVGVRFGRPGTVSARTTLQITWANAMCLELLGLTADEVVGVDLERDDTMGLDGLPHWSTVVHRLVAEDAVDPTSGDIWTDAVVDGPGRTLWPVQVRTAAAGPDCYVVWLRSVSEGQRLAEAAQQESEHRFRALAEHAPVGIVVSEAGVRLGFVNARFAEIAGRDQAGLTGIRWLRTVHPEDLPVLLATLDDVLAGTPAEANIRLHGQVELNPGIETSIDSDVTSRWVQIRLSPVTTPRRSAGFIGTVEDVTDRRAWERQLAYQAGHDALTGLANRRSLVDALSQLLSSRRTRDRDAAVLFCDLDGFKQVNDTLGHEAGDRVLIEVGQRLSATARDHDLTARIAGDEFVVLIREIGSITDAEKAAARQLEALAAPIVVAGTSVVVSASVGIAMAHDYDTAAQLLRAADRGMYEAKRSGRGHYRHSPPAVPDDDQASNAPQRSSTDD